MAGDSKVAKAKLNQEQIINGFNALRQEQRGMASKVVELESDASEHNLVVDALKKVEGSRKCFRMVGGVLIERTVGEVLPSIEKNKDMITKLVDNLKAQVVTKGKEINEYMDKNNIQIRQEGSMNEQQALNEGEGSSGVLVKAEGGDAS